MKPSNEVARLLGRYDSPSSERMHAAIHRVGERLRSGGDDASRERISDLDAACRPRRFGRIVFAAAAAALFLTVGISMAVRTSLRKNVDAYAISDSPAASLSRVLSGNLQVVRLGERIEAGELLRANSVGAAITLADGSRVNLRAQTEFFVERAGDGIRIHLKRGGLIVHAAKQRTGHLYVQTKDVVVSVVGTVFLVNAAEEGSRVAVIEGEVRVQQGETTRSLLPGDQMATNPEMPQLPLGEFEVLQRRTPEATIALLNLAEEMAQEANALVRSVREQNEKFGVVSIRIRPVTANEGLGQRSMTPDPNSGGGSCSGSLTISPGRIVITRASVHYLVSLAYGVGGAGNVQSFNCLNATRMGLLSGGPDWMASNRFEIEALIPEGPPAYTTKANGRGTVYTPEPRLRTLLQNLLTDRFKLQLRRETKEVSVYVLTAAAGGPKLKPIKEGERATGGGLVLQPGGAALIYERGPIAQLVTRLSTALNRPVLDRTSISGDFDFQALFDPTTEYFNIMGYVPPAPSGQPSLFTVLGQEFGLKLEASRAPIEVWTVDQVEKPSEN